MLPQGKSKVISLLEFFEAAKRYELLKHFESRHLEKLAGLAREAQFKSNHIIFSQGEKACFFYFLVEGKVALESVTAGQGEVVQTLEAGDALGWSAVTDAKDGAHFAARCLTPVRAFAFDGAQLRAACESDPAFGYVMMKALLGLVCERLDATRMQLSSRC